jgi:hypothetical protein
MEILNVGFGGLYSISDDVWLGLSAGDAWRYL